MIAIHRSAPATIGFSQSLIDFRLADKKHLVENCTVSRPPGPKGIDPEMSDSRKNRMRQPVGSLSFTRNSCILMQRKPLRPTN